jgi:hypothetical protein
MAEPELNDITADESGFSSEVLELANALQSLGNDSIYNMLWSTNIRRSQRLQRVE